jgi:hypothetical protein
LARNSRAKFLASIVQKLARNSCEKLAGKYLQRLEGIAEQLCRKWQGIRVLNNCAEIGKEFACCTTVQKLASFRRDFAKFVPKLARICVQKFALFCDSANICNARKY